MFYEIYLNIKYFIICKSLKLKNIKWQRDFALCRSNDLPSSRGKGITTAVILRALIFGENAENIFKIFLLDPYFHKNKKSQDFTINKYFEFLNLGFIFYNKRKSSNQHKVKQRLYMISDSFLCKNFLGFRL